MRCRSAPATTRSVYVAGVRLFTLGLQAAAALRERRGRLISEREGGAQRYPDVHSDEIELW